MTFGTLAEWKDWAEGGTAVDAPLDGLGDAAFTGPQGKDTLLAFRKGSRAVRIVSTKLNDDGTRMVSAAQLREIADLLESRLP